MDAAFPFDLLCRNIDLILIIDMAKNIQASASFTVSSDGLSVNGSASYSAATAGDDIGPVTQNIGTTTEQIAFGDVTTPGRIFIKNVDTTNFVQIGIGTPVSDVNAIFTILPGEGFWFPTRQATWYAKADTAPVNIQLVISEI